VIDASTFDLLLMVLTGWLTRRERALWSIWSKNTGLRRRLGGRRLPSGRRA
jgi:hypothetical protein